MILGFGYVLVARCRALLGQVFLLDWGLDVRLFEGWIGKNMFNILFRNPK